MSEYIITQEELEFMFTRINNELNKGTRKLRIDFREIPEIVRCRDCTVYDGEGCGCSYGRGDDPDGFCAWGIKKEVGAHFWRCECGAENYGFETCQYCGRSER